MAKKDREPIARRVWNLLRLALLWTRKGGVFKRRLMMELRVVPKFLRSLGHTTPRGQISYTREKELSFEKTPISHVKMYRPTSMRFSIPCMTAPQVDFDYEYDGNSECDYYNYDDDDDGDGNKSFLMTGGNEEDCEKERVQEEEEWIDLKAEEFIAKFYEQIKLQRQISHLQYNEGSIQPPDELYIQLVYTK